MSLQNEIDLRAKEIHTDGYPMSIGEIISLYNDGELDIHPEFQRFFRWTHLQKTKLIESILLGIPIPPIFVSQRDDGVWDVIDGLQRLSTIFEFVGILKDINQNLIPAGVLSGTEYLPSLEGKYWQNQDDPQNSFDQSQRLIIKRSKLSIQIIKKESDKDTKFELFQRLNTGGTALSEQEIRNCILVMVNPDFYKWLKALSAYENFKKCIPLSENALAEQYDVELALRFFIYKASNGDDIKASKDIGKYVTDKMIGFASDEDFNYDSETEIFKKTFDLLASTFEDEEAFKKYDKVKGKFTGAFSISAFEVIASGLSKFIDNYTLEEDTRLELLDKVMGLWDNETFMQRSGSGSRASTRLPYFIPLGIEIYKK